jgi:phosphotransferase system HPr-like phosphotransfer protein
MVNELINVTKQVNLCECNKIVDIAKKYNSSINFFHDGTFLDAKRIFMVTQLQDKVEQLVLLTIKGEDEQEAYNELYNYVRKVVFDY